MKRRESPSLLNDLPRGAEVLIIRLRSLGDVVLLTPALSALNSWRPDLRLCVLVEPAFAPLLEANPAIAEILPMGGFLPAATKLRRRHFSVVYNQHAGPTSALLTAAIGAPKRVCWTRRQFSFLYNVLVPDPGDKIHTVEHRIEQFYATGLPRGPIPPARVYPQVDAPASVSIKLLESGIPPDTKYAVIHPGAKYFTKRWALENFVALAQWLKHERGIAPVFSVGAAEKEIAQQLQQKSTREFAVMDSLGLRELIALVAGARIFIGNDSGPAHLAAAVACPVVAIFGSSSSVHWAPWRTAHRVVQNDFPCNPCAGDRCYAFAEPRCILSITLEQVKTACDSLLAQTETLRDSRTLLLGNAE